MITVSKPTRFFAVCLAAGLLHAAVLLAGEQGGSYSPEQATAFALSLSGDGQVMELDRHYGGDGLYFYRLEIAGADGYCHVEIDAADGRLLKFIRKPRHGHRGGGMAAMPPATVPPAVLPDSGSAAAASPALTLEQAREIALQHTAGGTVIKSKLERKRRYGTVFEFEIVNNGLEYEVVVDAAGTVVKFEIDD